MKGLNRRGNYHPVRLNLKKGSLWVQDPRNFHRGTPNRSDHPRDELCMAFSVPWLFSQWLHEYTEKHFPRDLWESLPPSRTKGVEMAAGERCVKREEKHDLKIYGEF